MSLQHPLGDSSQLISEESGQQSQMYAIDIDAHPQMNGAEGEKHMDPEVEDERMKAISEVAKLRDVLNSVGDKPDHESVDVARVSISEIESKLSRKLEEIYIEACPEGVSQDEWSANQAEKEHIAKESAEKEIFPFKAVVQLYEMHEQYENWLNLAEQRLAKLCVSETKYSEGKTNPESLVENETDEEVIRILQESTQRNLEVVDLNGRALKHLPEAFCKISFLKVLDLSSNELEILPDSIAGLVNLEELLLSANSLSRLPDSIGLLRNLRILNISMNKLKALPNSICHCSALVELDASFNELSYLPTNIGNELLNLQRLDVHLNKLRYLPSSVCNMTSLQVLDVHFNELRSLPATMGNLESLQILDVSSNFSDLTSIPETIGDLTNLVEINLSNNQIRELPISFGRLENVKKLELDQNPMSFPPQYVIVQGTAAIMEYMTKSLVDFLLEQERKVEMERNIPEIEQGWVQRGQQAVGGWFSTVTGSLSEYLGTNNKNKPEDYDLNQQF